MPGRVLFLLAAFGLPAIAHANGAVLDNDYVRVTRNAAPCAAAGAGCAERVVVALGRVSVAGKTLERGQIAVFERGRAFEAPAGEFLEVAFKPGRPAVLAPAVRIAPEKNETLYDSDALFVFEE